MEVDGILLPVHYAKRPLTQYEQKYSMYKLEFLACLFGVERFRMYIKKQFILQTDNMAVSYILNQKKLQGKFARWSVRLQEFDFKIEHVRETLYIADPLSHMFEQDSEVESIWMFLNARKFVWHSCTFLNFFTRYLMNNAKTVNGIK